jgi:hypothetical protein
MRTLVRYLAIPAVAATLLAACGSDEDSSGTTTTPSTVATTSAPTTAAPTTAAPTTAAPTTASTAPPSTAAPTTIPDERPVSGEGVEIIVTVGLDDAITAGGRVEHVPLGSDVTLRVFDSKAHEYHLHGYDLEQEVPANVEAVFQFKADQPGQFELETHDGDQVLVVLEVS